MKDSWRNWHMQATCHQNWCHEVMFLDLERFYDHAAWSIILCQCVYIHQKKFESIETMISLASLCNDIDDFACLFTCFLLSHFSTSDVKYLFLFFLNLITLWFIVFLEHGWKPYLGSSVSRVSHAILNSYSHNKTRVQLMWTLTIYSQVKY